MKLTKKRIFAGVMMIALAVMLIVPVGVSAASSFGCASYSSDQTDCEDQGCTYTAQRGSVGDSDYRAASCSGLIMPDGPTTATLDEMLGNVIDAIMGILGFIAVIVILVGGFQWMTAGGESDKVDKAKDTLKAGIIGIVITVAAWAIINFVIDILV